MLHVCFVRLVLCKLSGGSFMSCVSQRLQVTSNGAHLDMDFMGLAPVGTRLMFAFEQLQGSSKLQVGSREPHG